MNFLSKLFNKKNQTTSESFIIGKSWLQMPTLRSVGYLVDVVGESHYQDAIESIVGERNSEGAVTPLVTAQLVRDPKNKYDSNAVRVEIDNKICGHIAKNNAPLFHSMLNEMSRLHLPATCRAWLIGGRDRGFLDKKNFEIKLDLHPSLEAPANIAILPFGSGRTSISGEEKYQEFLESILRGAKRVEVLASLGEPDEIKIEVSINENVVGFLTRNMSDRYRHWIAEVQSRGLPSTCEARVIQGEKKVEVFLKLAHPWKMDLPYDVYQNTPYFQGR